MNIATRNLVAINTTPHGRVNACLACGKKDVCPAANDTGAAAGQPVQKIVHASRSVHEAGDAFEGIYIVRSGFLKSYTIDSDGLMQVTGFHLPGEFFGMDGIAGGQYGAHVEALDTSSICRIPLELFTAPRHNAAAPGVLNADATMLTLVKLMSRTLSRDREMFYTLGKLSARRRFGAFLLDLSERMAASGYSDTRFTLCMSRTDIANYLCVALETVSRLFSQLQSEGVLDVERRNVTLLNKAALMQEPEKLMGIRKAG